MGGGYSSRQCLYFTDTCVSGDCTCCNHWYSHCVGCIVSWINVVSEIDRVTSLSQQAFVDNAVQRDRQTTVCSKCSFFASNGVRRYAQPTFEVVPVRTEVSKGKGREKGTREWETYYTVRCASRRERARRADVQRGDREV